jgi:F-type H+-transporting ATPase subunit a
MMLSLLAAPFEKPTTRDFVWPCIGGSVKFGGITVCFNFIILLLLIAFLSFILLFFVAFSSPRIVPERTARGKLQLVMEYGLDFVRTQILHQMIGPEGTPFLPLLATLFFFIFLGNILEVVPLFGFPLNSRLAFPLVMALISWATYNYVGVRRHGLWGYLKSVMFPPGAPLALYILLTPIELISVIFLRPVTLTIRLFANMVAGHFLLSVFFLGSLALITGVPYLLGVVSFGIGVVLVAFEIFVSALQAFIFAVLTASYIGGAMAEEH